MSKGKHWKVVGTQSVLGHPPGSVFQTDLPEDTETFLKNIGAIRAVSAPAKDPDRAVEKAAAEAEREQEAERRAPPTAGVDADADK